METGKPWTTYWRMEDAKGFARRFFQPRFDGNWCWAIFLCISLHTNFHKFSTWHKTLCRSPLLPISFNTLCVFKIFCPSSWIVPFMFTFKSPKILVIGIIFWHPGKCSSIIWTTFWLIFGNEIYTLFQLQELKYLPGILGCLFLLKLCCIVYAAKWWSNQICSRFAYVNNCILIFFKTNISRNLVFIF